MCIVVLAAKADANGRIDTDGILVETDILP
jgi:hypothetical protein